MNRFLRSMSIGTAMAMAVAIPASAADVYIIGGNVNGASWALADPDALMTQVDDNLYEWHGDVLGTNFKLNDGTWDFNLFPGTNIVADLGSNGSELALGEEYILTEKADNILFADKVKEVKNATVTFNMSTLALTVTGDPVVDNGPDPLYLRGDFNDWAALDDYEFVLNDEDGFYHLDKVSLQTGFYAFKIANSDWTVNIGSAEDELFFGEWNRLVRGSNPQNIAAYFETDLYQFIYNPEEEMLYVAAVSSGIPYDTFQLSIADGEGEWTKYPMRANASSNGYVIRSVTLHPGMEFILESPLGGRFAAERAGVKVTEANPDCTLTYFADDAMVMKYTVAVDLEGEFDIAVDFYGEKANLTFSKIETPEIDYAAYYFQWGNSIGMEVKQVSPTDDPNVFMIEGVDLPELCQFALVSRDNTFFAAPYYGLSFTDEDFTCELEYWNGTQDWDPYYAVTYTGGKYDITVTFEGTTAVLDFKRKSDAEVNPENVLLFIRDGGIYTPVKESDLTVTYKDVLLDEWDMFILQDRISGTAYGNIDSDNPPLSPSNLTVTLEKDPQYYIETEGLIGTFDVTATFNPEMTQVSLTLIKHELPVEIAAYEGDLYLIGSMNDWELADPDYKMTCVEPGVFEWIGDMTDISDLSFKINGGDWNVCFPGTDTYIDFGLTSDSKVEMGNTYAVSFDGYDISIKGNPTSVKNMKVTLSIPDMVIKFTCTDMEYAPIDLDMVTLITQSGAASGRSEVTENSVIFKDVTIKGNEGVALHAGGNIYFGWPDPDGTIVTDENPETTVYNSLYLGSGAYYVATSLNGSYDIEVVFNELTSEATMKFVKVIVPVPSDPSLTVMIENGTSFKVESQSNDDLTFQVSTNDPYWIITGYTFEDVRYTLDPVGSSIMFTWTLQPDEVLLFHTEYQGICEILGNQNSVAEFDNNVIIERTAEGVSIRNVEIGTDIVVYSMGGQVVSMMKADSTEMSIRLEQGQVYIVRAGNVAAKVM